MGFPIFSPRYPNEGLSRALGNVFDFDSYEADIRELLLEVLSKHGIPVGLESDFKVQLGEILILPEPRKLEVWNMDSVRKGSQNFCEYLSSPLHIRVI